MSRVPPHDLEAEKMVLGCMMFDYDSAVQAMDTMVPEDFYRTSHQKLFAALCELCEQGKDFDELLLREHLKAKGELGDVGGVQAIREIAELFATAAFTGEYIDVARSASVRRALLHAAHELERACHNPAIPLDELLEQTETDFLKVTEPATPTGLMQAGSRADGVNARIDGESAQFTPTGMGALDDVIDGFGKGEYIILAARTSVGKSSLAYFLTSKMIEADPELTVLFFTLEVTADKVLEAMCSARSGDDPRMVYDKKCNASAFREALDFFSKSHLYVDDSASLTVQRIRTACLRHHRRHKIGLIVVDYAQLISGPRKKDGRQAELEAISLGLKSLAIETGAPVLTLCQLNREADGSDPRLSHLKGSGSFEQDADKVLFLHRVEDAKREKVNLIIAKNRHGRSGSIPLTFIPFCRRFQERW